MAENGMTVKQGTDMTRMQVTCEHQSGLIYVVPAQRSWVCDPETILAHALAGFFRELVALNHPGVRDLMGQWGIYYRELPLEGNQESSAEK